MESAPAWISAAASSITAVGVVLGWWQIRLTKQQAITDFEDRLTSEYRKIVQRLPVAALLGEAIDEDNFYKHLGDFYQYIDLTNQQIFLRQSGRVSDNTWKEWLEGIRWNLSCSAFFRAWEEIKNRSPESFENLSRLLTSAEDEADPLKW